MDQNEFFIRILFCFALSILIGIERQFRNGTVGLRTNVLVSLGSFMFMITSFNLTTNDETRIAAQIVSGIGFLGAGVILKDGNKIKGLNTAATLWCVASVGVLTASGLLFEATIGTIFVLLSNIFLRIISLGIMKKLNNKPKKICEIILTCNRKSEDNIRASISKNITKNNLYLASLEKNSITKDEVQLKANIVTSRTELVESMVSTISADPDIIKINWKQAKYIETTSDDSDENNNED